MCDSPYLPPLIGTLFEMPDGRRIVPLLFRRRLRNAWDHLYLEIEDTRGRYFSAMFDEIVQSSADDNKLAPVGRVMGQRFRVLETKFRWSVLIDGSGAKSWLAMVLVVTWRVRNGKAEPLLQLRSHLNATRELDRLTHLAGHITYDDRPVQGMEFGLDDVIPIAAAQRRVQMETGKADTGELTPLTTGTYIYPDKENLFFFVYSCRLPDHLEFWRQAEISPVSVPDLLSIRRNQVRMSGTPSDEAAVVTRLMAWTWLERFRAQRDHLRASVPGRSGQPSRYRDLIAAVAEHARCVPHSTAASARLTPMRRCKPAFRNGSVSPARRRTPVTSTSAGRAAMCRPYCRTSSTEMSS